MLQIPGHRRDFLRVGGFGLAGLTLADVLRADARSAARPKSVIPFKPGATKLPGVQICDQMSRQAAIMDRLAPVPAANTGRTRAAPCSPAAA